MGKVYRGYRLKQRAVGGGTTTLRCVVLVQDGGREYELPPRLELRHHSPTGFEWGYCGSGPAQLALALVADATESSVCEPAVYQHVKRAVVARLPKDGWVLTAGEIQLRAELVKKALAGELPPLPPAGDAGGEGRG